MRRQLLLIAMACAAAFALAGPAEAQDGVFVDPDSPTAHEYDIPLERARRDASADPAAPRPYRSRTAPLFGEGINGADNPAATAASSAAGPTQAPANRTPASQTGTKNNEDAGRSSSHSPIDPDKRLPRTVEAAIRRPGAPAESRTAQLAGFAGALLVGLGLLGGAMVRRRSRR